MQSHNDAGYGCKSSAAPKNTWMKGKENGLNAPKCPQQGMSKPQNPPRSRLPIPSKTKEPPDFQKLHQSWQNQFHKGKAVRKKSCTRPQPFNFSQKGDCSQVTSDTVVSTNPQTSHRRREPLAEVTLGQKLQESKDADVKVGSDEFKADPAALASILSNAGVPIAAIGKLSLAQRVPMRASSIAQSTNNYKNTMVRSSMYDVLRSKPASSNLDRISYFSKMQNKDVNTQKPVFGQNSLLKKPIPDCRLEEQKASSHHEEQQSQENPVLQQMNPPPVQASGVTSLSLRSHEVTAVKSPPLPPVTEDGDPFVLPADKVENNTSETGSPTEKSDSTKKTGAAPIEFSADSQALASILSNTGVTIANCGKVSLAQRVPVQARNVTVKTGTTSSGSVVMQVTTPKPCFGRMSAMAVPIKDVAFSPCRVPKTLMSDTSSSGSAKRVQQLTSSAMKFSQRSTSKQPFFPKTPRALALEMANKKLETELSNTRSSARSTVKWADELSPSLSETLIENEPKMEQVAVRLFLDGECPGDMDMKKEPLEESTGLKELEGLAAKEQKRLGTTLPSCSINKSDVISSAGVSQDLPFCLAKAADPPVQSTSMASCMKTSLPLSFLSHPAVQALQCHTLGPYSLPEIGRLRIQAAVSAKQRFWETCLDEECAFYTSRGAVSSCRNCVDPVSSFLDRQEDLHFTPIIPGEP
ncbi:tastin isoform X2 [Engystomops pustulosus]|uniref:tastin isoform X2 n=1 Tax=Engystomops pustulosus TaxID=76066 RepID=UPI003AFAA7D0